MPVITPPGTTWAPSTNTDVRVFSRTLPCLFIILTRQPKHPIRPVFWGNTMPALCSTKDWGARKIIARRILTSNHRLKVGLCPPCTCWPCAIVTAMAWKGIQVRPVSGYPRRPWKGIPPLLRSFMLKALKTHRFVSRYVAPP